MGAKAEGVPDRTGVPVGVAADAASAPEAAPGPAALAGIPAAVPVAWGAPVLADRAHDGDPPRGRLAGDGSGLVARHRRNRVRPPTADGRPLRRLSRRRIVERTFAWLHSFRRVVTRFEKDAGRHDGLVPLACAFIALGWLVKQPQGTPPPGWRHIGWPIAPTTQPLSTAGSVSEPVQKAVLRARAVAR